ncbi:MAG: trimethylamine methyltransferase family protein [Hyphomicrobiaceae bacterium]
MPRGNRRQTRRASNKPAGQTVQPAPYITRGIRPYDLLTDDALAAIEATADRILSEIGIECRGDPPSLELFREAGADVQGERVRFEPGFCRSLIQTTAPRTFTQHARNPARSVQIGGDATVFVPAYGPPFVRGVDTERRYARLDDFEMLVKLAYLSPHLHHSGGTVCEPTDIPVTKRHLDMVYAHLKYSDKAFMGGVTSGERAADSIRMAEIAFGEDFISRNCVIQGLININSPLVMDVTMLEALRTYAAAGQGTVITPFIIGGAAGAVTPAAMLAQSLAETLAGMALTQLVRPGAPVIFGFLSTGLDMKSGAPVRYDETWRCFLAAGQLARRLGVPFRTGSTTTTSKVADFQAGMEGALSLWPVILSGANFMIHATGNIEGGLGLDFEKFMLECEMLGMFARFLEGVDTSEDALGFDAIAEAGPGGNFLATSHTLARYRDAFFASDLLDTSSFEQWRDDGGHDAVARAHKRRMELLDGYEPPPLDPAIDEALLDFMARRKAELPDSFA